jgi:flagellar basal-body rod protein FlgF
VIRADVVIAEAAIHAGGRPQRPASLLNGLESWPRQTPNGSGEIPTIEQISPNMSYRESTENLEEIVTHRFGSVRALWASNSMDQAAVAAAGGLHTRMQALDLLANNLANSSTNGFKLDREFYSLFSAEDTGNGESPSQLPYVKSQWTDFSQGTLSPTGNPLDTALTGQGFFVVNGPSGPLYTRNGSFQLSSSGQLNTADGYPVADASGGTIQLQPGQAVQIGPDGTILQDGQTVGQLQIVDFQDRRVLQKAGNTYFTNSQPAAAQTIPSDAKVSQGQVEQSNVVAAESAVRLVGVMRQSEMLQKAISMSTEMNKEALQEVARVAGGTS